MNQYVQSIVMEKKLTMAVVFILISCFWFSHNIQAQIRTFDRQGYTVSLYSYNFGRSEGERIAALNQAKATGANSLIFDFHLEQASLSASSIYWQHDLEVLMQEVALAKDLGIHTLVKPVVMIGPNGTNWQNINTSNSNQWFQEYEARLMEVLTHTNASSIDALVLTNELHSMTENPAYRDDWETLIANLRTVFSGEIGVNAGAFLGYFKPEDEEYFHVQFYDALDFMGFSSYPRLFDNLTQAKAATRQQFYDNWSSARYDRDYKQEVADFIAGHPNLDVYFTEIGSPGTDGGVYALTSNTFDFQEQSDFYDATIDVLSSISGLDGIYVYNWHANTAGEGFGPTKPDGTQDFSYRWNINDKISEETITQGFLNLSGPARSLNVINGDGDGSFQSGRIVNISADPPALGMRFSHWSGTSGFFDQNNPNTTFAMPASSVTVTANYVQDLPANNAIGNWDFSSGSLNPWIFSQNTANASASVVGGEAVINIVTSGSQSWHPGLEQTGLNIVGGANYRLKLDARAASPRTIVVGLDEGGVDRTLIFLQDVPLTTSMQSFEYTFTPTSSSAAANIFINLGGAGNNIDVTLDNIIVENLSSTTPTYSLTVNNGTGSGSFAAGTVRTIAATVPSGMTFDKWTGATAHISNVNSPNTTVTIPSNNITVSATFSGNTSGNTTWERQGYTVPMFSYTQTSQQAQMDASYAEAAATNANSLILDFHLQTSSLTSSNVNWFPGHTKEKLLQSVVKAKNAGFHVLIKPILMIGGATNWQQFDPDPAAPNNSTNSTKVNNWFNAYQTAIEDIFTDSRASQIDAFIITNELHHMTIKYTSKWVQFVNAIRNNGADNFNGEIGVNAGAFLGFFTKSNEEFDQINDDLYKVLDFAGLSSYPRLTPVEDATTATSYQDFYNGWLKAQWGRNYKEELRLFIDRIQSLPPQNGISDRKVYFTEIGTPAISGGIHSLDGSGIAWDEALQARFYDATTDILGSLDQLAGIYVYDWHANTSGLGYDKSSLYNASNGKPYAWNIASKTSSNESKPLITERYELATNEQFKLEVVGGSITGGGSSGIFAPGSNVNIQAPAINGGLSFKKWQGIDNIVNDSDRTTSITMPIRANALATALYVDPLDLDNAMDNGAFTLGTEDWIFAPNVVASGDISVQSGELVINITSHGSEPYQPSVMYVGLTLEAGKSYTLSFDARTQSGTKTISYGVGGGNLDDPWADDVTLTSSMQSYSHSFNAIATAYDHRVTFNVGGSSTNVIIDNVKITENTGTTNYNLNVVSGTSNKSQYTAGEVATITASPPSPGYIFDKWVGYSFTNENNQVTTLVMPANHLTVTATYRQETGSGETVRYEAEDAALSGVAVGTGVPNYSGTGHTTRQSFANGDKITFTVNAASTGNFNLDISYNTISNKTDRVYVNGVHVADVEFVNTNNIWTVKNVGDISLNMGSNTVEIEAWWGFVDYDYIEVTGDNGSGPTTYSLAVQNGTSNKSTYEAGETATITANPAPSGQVFDQWTGHTFANASNAVTTLIMPSNNLTVTATYKDAPPSGNWTVLDFENFEGGFGHYADGGKHCILYTGGTYSSQGTNALNLQSVGDLATATLTISDLPNGGLFTSSAQLRIRFEYYVVSFDNSNEDFWVQYNDGSGWTTIEDFVLNTDFQNNEFKSAEILITNSEYNFTTNGQIRFRCDASGGADDVYIDEVEIAVNGTGSTSSYNLIVNNGNGDGTYTVGEIINISANSAPSGQVFDKWTGNVSNVDDVNNANTNITIPAFNATVTATYKAAPTGGTIRYEAENATLTGLMVGSNIIGFSGTGHVTKESFTEAGDKMVFNVNVGATGTYQMTVRHHGISHKEQYVDINGSSAAKLITEDTNNAWETLNYGNVSLNAGNNTIEIRRHWGFVDIDYIEISDPTGARNQYYKDENMEANFGLYPNPVLKGSLNVVYDGTFSISIVSISGQTLRRYDHLSGTQTLNVRDLQPGMYVVHFATDNQQESIRLVIQ